MKKALTEKRWRSFLTNSKVFNKQAIVPHGIVDNIDGIAEYELTKKRPETLQTPMVNRSATLLHSTKPNIGLSDEFVNRENVLWIVFLACAIIETWYRHDFVNVKLFYKSRYV
jgi:hypothetical protein